MRILARLVQCTLAALLVLAPTVPATAVSSSGVVTASEWLDWLRSQARSFDHQTAKTALAIRLHVDSPTTLDLRGVANADGSLAVSFATDAAKFDVKCVDDHTCWVRQVEGGPDLLWHRVSANELIGLRGALPEVDGLLDPGITCQIDGATGRLDYDGEGTVVTAAVSFAGGAFTLDERLSIPADGVSLRVTKSLSPTRQVVVRPPRSAVIGPPMIQDVIPELP